MVHFHLLLHLCLISHVLQAFLQPLCSFIRVLQCRCRRLHHHYLMILLHSLLLRHTRNLLRRSSYHCHTLHLISSSDGYLIVAAVVLGQEARLPFFLRLKHLGCSDRLVIFLVWHSAVLSVRLATVLDYACLEDYV